MKYRLKEGPAQAAARAGTDTLLARVVKVFGVGRPYLRTCLPSGTRLE